MKKRLATIIILVFVLMTITALAMPSNAKTYGDLTYAVLNGEIRITKCDRSASGEMIIPAEIDGYPVTSIYKSAFIGCAGLTSVVIPDGVTSIGGSAFSGCRGLTSVVIPGSVKSMGRYIFGDCTNLVSAKIGNGAVISGSMFENCTALTSVEISDGVTMICSDAFKNCTSLNSVHIPESVNIIDVYAFWGCTGLTSVYIDSSTIASSLTKKSQEGDLIYYADAIMIERSITEVPDRIIVNYPDTEEVTYNGKQYMAYKAHDFSGDWISDGSNHWHSCLECGEIGDKESHRFHFPCGTTCESCGCVRTITHRFSIYWSTNETSHWHNCDCGERADEMPHTWDDGKVTKNPTPTAKGVRTYTCTVCASTRTESIDKLPNDPKNDFNEIYLEFAEQEYVYGVVSSYLTIIFLACVVLIVLFIIIASHAVALVGAIVLYIMNLIKKKKNKRSQRSE